MSTGGVKAHVAVLAAAKQVGLRGPKAARSTGLAGWFERWLSRP